jgi:hypothetical protein
MKAKDLKTVNLFLKEYGAPNTASAVSGSAAVKSVASTNTPAQPSQAATAPNAKPKPNAIAKKAGAVLAAQVPIGAQVKNDQGQIIGIRVAAETDNKDSPEVVIKDPTGKLHVVAADSPVYSDNTQLNEIDFNQKKLINSSLAMPIQCGFEAETVWPDIANANNEVNSYYGWIQDEVSAQDADRIESAYYDWLAVHYISDIESKFAADWADDNWGQFYPDFIDSEKLDDEWDTYSEENPDESVGDFIMKNYQDEYKTWLIVFAIDNGQAYDDAWDEARATYDIDDFARAEYGGVAEMLAEFEIWMMDEDGMLEEVASRLSYWAHDNSEFRDTKSGGYHAYSNDTSQDYWRVESDSSIEGDGAAAEIISPVYSTPLEMLNEMESLFKYMSRNDVVTNSSTGLHVTMSWSGEEVEQNSLKMVVLSGDQYLLKQFNREQSGYTPSQYAALVKAAKELSYDINSAKSLAEVEKILKASMHKSWNRGSLNFKKLRNESNNSLVEFRIMGGNYLTRIEDIKRAVSRYAVLMQAGHDEQAYHKDYVLALLRLVANLTKQNPIFRQGRREALPIHSKDPLVLAVQNQISDDVYSRLLDLVQQADINLDQYNRTRYHPNQRELFTESDEADWKKPLLDAQSRAVRALTLVAIELSVMNKPIPARIFGAVKAFMKRYGLTAQNISAIYTQQEMWKEYQKSTKADTYSSRTLVASALNKLLRQEVIVVPDPAFTISVTDEHRVLISEPASIKIYDSINSNQMLPANSIKLSDFRLVPREDFYNIVNTYNYAERQYRALASDYISDSDRATIIEYLADKAPIIRQFCEDHGVNLKGFTGLEGMLKVINHRDSEIAALRQLPMFVLGDDIVPVLDTVTNIRVIHESMSLETQLLLVESIDADQYLGKIKAAFMKKIMANPIPVNNHGLMMEIFKIIPDPKLIDEFRQLAATSKPETDARPIVKKYLQALKRQV